MILRSPLLILGPSAMNVLRMVKLFGWEKKMNERIAEKREDELRYIWKQRILEVCTTNIKFVSLSPSHSAYR